MLAIVFIAVLALIVLSIVSMGRVSGLADENREIMRRLDHLRAQLERIQNTVGGLGASVHPQPPVAGAAPPAVVSKQPEAAAAEKSAATPATAFAAKPFATAANKRQEPPLLRQETAAKPPPPKEPGRFEKEAREILRKTWSWIIVGDDYRKGQTSVEFAVASNWLLRIGIACTVVGIGYFLKYSLERGWMSPTGRTATTMLTGAAMVAAGVRMASGKYRVMGQGLMGGGIAALYFSVFAAFHLYHGLIPLLPAFGLMILITAASAIIAMQTNSMLMAIIGVVGGYSTPVMLSTGRVDFVGLFSYMLILNLGICGMASRKRWYLLNYLSLLFTYGMAAVALHRSYDPALFWKVMPFMAAFFALFSGVAFIHNIFKKTLANLLDVAFLLVNAAVFFAAGHFMVGGRFGGEWTSLLSVALAAFYVAHICVFMSRRLLCRELLITFMGLAAFFLVITMPLLLSRQWITLSWALEALVMLWISVKLESNFLRHAAMLLYAIMLWRFAFIDLRGHFSDSLAPGISLRQYLPVLLERLLSSLLSIGSLGGAWAVLKKSSASERLRVERENDIPQGISGGAAGTGILVAMFGVLFVFLNFEFSRSFGVIFPPLRLPMLTALWTAMCLLLLVSHFSTRSSWTLGLFSAFAAATVLKLFFFDLAHWRLMERGLYDPYGQYSFLEAFMRLLDFGFIVLLLAYAWRSLGRDFPARGLRVVLGSASLALLFIWSSLETNTGLYRFIPDLRSGGVSILWTLFALSFVLAGILRGVRPLRFAGLILFAVVALKVFLVDMSRLHQIWRFVAFIVLGVLILCGSFLYLRFQQKFIGQKPAESSEKIDSEA